METDLIIGLIADIIQGVAVLITLIALLLELRQSRKARDMEIMMNLSTSFRRRWEGKWEKIVRPRDGIGEDYPWECEREIRHMLNWVDWLGTCMRTGGLHDERVILESIGIPIREIIHLGRDIIEEDIKENGLEYWRSMLYVARELDVTWVSNYD